ncbi:MAG: ABC transporter substrate-binding protein [Holosporales bacterium]|jgi:putative ABC transport system substrate-binding protein|nr:ABC transporter substrate-binding protein [Holosporales bacterium]
MFKKIAAVMLGSVMMMYSSLCATGATDKNKEEFKITICKAAEHEALNSVAKGIRDYLKKYSNIEYDVLTCQGNQGTAFQMASKAANDKSNVLVTIGTLPTQAAFSFAKNNKIKLVFGSVTNPADISADLKGTNTTGVSNFVSLQPQIEMFQKIQPNLKKLGILYNSGESNSVAIVKELKTVLSKMGIALIEQSIQKSSDIPQAINSIVKKVDAVFISNDNTVLAAIPLVVKTCTNNKIPAYVSDTDQVEKGCLAALGPNQYDIGVQAGKIIEKIRGGADVNKIDVEYPAKTELFINLDAAKAIGITIPQEVIDKADRIIGENKK